MLVNGIHSICSLTGDVYWEKDVINIVKLYDVSPSFLAKAFEIKTDEDEERCASSAYLQHCSRSSYMFVSSGWNEELCRDHSK